MEEPEAILHVRVSAELKSEIEQTAEIMRKHFAGARFTQSDVVRYCIENHIQRLREMYR